jgi:hypothetical protein
MGKKTQFARPQVAPVVAQNRGWRSRELTWEVQNAALMLTIVLPKPALATAPSRDVIVVVSKLSPMILARHNQNHNSLTLADPLTSVSAEP